jgi:class 3 adenylate cyclase
VAAEYGWVVATGNNFPAPFGWWLYLVGTAVVTGVGIDWLVSRTRRLARAEREARLELERAHQKLEVTNRELAGLTETLERRVGQQVEELQTLGQLRRFLSPQVADTLLERGHEELLEPHRREIAVLFCDLRGFTAFTSEVEPEDVLAVLSDYYDCVGGLLRRFDATIGPLSGDGIMAYFGDPIPCDDPARRAVELAIAARHEVQVLVAEWRGRGLELGCGFGIAAGYATLGLIGFEGKRDYGPVGSVVNRASRLCDEAGAGQILVDATIRRQLGEGLSVEEMPPMELKGFPRPVPGYLVND